MEILGVLIYLNNLSSSELKGIQPWLLIKIAGEAEANDFFARPCIIWHCVEHSECVTADDSDRELPVVVTERTAQRGDRTMRGLKEHETRPLLEQLSALGWLKRVDALRPSSPPHWQVNPAVHKKFADRAVREAKRREATRKMMRKLSKK